MLCCLYLAVIASMSLGCGAGHTDDTEMRVEEALDDCREERKVGGVISSLFGYCIFPESGSLMTPLWRFLSENYTHPHIV